MAIANGAIYPIVVAQALRPSLNIGRAAALQNTLQLLRFPASPWFHGSFIVARRC